MRKRAFTLTELLVAISIIAILISVSMPAGKVAKGAANQFVATNAIGTLQMSTSIYCSDSDETPPLAISQKSFEPTQTCLGTQTGQYQFDAAQSLLEPYLLGKRNKDPIFKANASFGDSSVFGY